MAEGGGAPALVVRIAAARPTLREVTAAAVLLCAGATTLLAPYAVMQKLREREVMRSLLVISDDFLRRPLPTGTSIGVFWAGVPAYFLPGTRFHDLLGKSDAHIARTSAKWGMPGHNKWDYDYSLGQIRPDLIITSARSYQTDSTLARGMKCEDRPNVSFFECLWVHPLFRSGYAAHPMEFAADAEAPALHRVYLRE